MLIIVMKLVYEINHFKVYTFDKQTNIKIWLHFSLLKQMYVVLFSVINWRMN